MELAGVGFFWVQLYLGNGRIRRGLFVIDLLPPFLPKQKGAGTLSSMDVCSGRNLANGRGDVGNRAYHAISHVGSEKEQSRCGIVMTSTSYVGYHSSPIITLNCLLEFDKPQVQFPPSLRFPSEAKHAHCQPPRFTTDTARTVASASAATTTTTTNRVANNRNGRRRLLGHWRFVSVALCQIFSYFPKSRLDGG